MHPLRKTVLILQHAHTHTSPPATCTYVAAATAWPCHFYYVLYCSSPDVFLVPAFSGCWRHRCFCYCRFRQATFRVPLLWARPSSPNARQIYTHTHTVDFGRASVTQHRACIFPVFSRAIHFLTISNRIHSAHFNWLLVFLWWKSSSACTISFDSQKNYMSCFELESERVLGNILALFFLLI